jgi:hypothetical protein
MVQPGARRDLLCAQVDGSREGRKRKVERCILGDFKSLALVEMRPTAAPCNALSCVAPCQRRLVLAGVSGTAAPLQSPFSTWRRWRRRGGMVV